MILTVELINQYMPQTPNVHYEVFQEKHLDDMRQYGFDGLSDAELAEEKSYIVAQTIEDAAFTIMYKDKPVCVFGCLLYWNGVAEMWSLISDDIRRFPLFLTKCGRTWADICEVAFKLHRLEITVRASDERATKWAFALGFKHESFMEKYSARREDFNLFVRINHGR
jgi:hypothetical protein